MMKATRLGNSSGFKTDSCISKAQKICRIPFLVTLMTKKTSLLPTKHLQPYSFLFLIVLYFRLICYPLGLRENYDIFPQEIYYCLSEAKIQEYKTRWSKSDGLWSNNDDLWSTQETKTGNLEQEVERLKQEVEVLEQEVEGLEREAVSRNNLYKEFLVLLLRKGG